MSLVTLAIFLHNCFRFYDSNAKYSSRKPLKLYSLKGFVYRMAMEITYMYVWVYMSSRWSVLWQFIANSHVAYSYVCLSIEKTTKQVIPLITSIGELRGWVVTTKQAIYFSFHLWICSLKIGPRPSSQTLFNSNLPSCTSIHRHNNYYYTLVQGISIFNTFMYISSPATCLY